MPEAVLVVRLYRMIADSLFPFAVTAVSFITVSFGEFDSVWPDDRGAVAELDRPSNANSAEPLFSSMMA